MLNFLYSEASWRFNALKKSNVTKDKDFLEPQPNDVVAIKIAGIEDYKLGVVVYNKRSPRIKVRTLTGGRQDLPYVHSLNLGLMYRDPPKPSGEEIAAENASLERATVGIKKAYEGQAKYILNSERLNMMKIHESLHFQGHHKGRTNLLTGTREEYYISDLNSSFKQEFIFRTGSMSDTGTKYVSNNRLISKKINLYLDRFISLTSS